MTKLNTYHDLPALNTPVTDAELDNHTNGVVVEPGIYDSRISNYEVKTANNGKPYIKLKFTVMTPTSTKGVNVYQSFFPYHDKTFCTNVWQGLLRSVGFSETLRAKFQPNTHLPALKGLGCQVRTGIEKFEGTDGLEKKKSAILNVFAAKNDTFKNTEDTLITALTNAEGTTTNAGTNPFNK